MDTALFPFGYYVPLLSSLSYLSALIGTPYEVDRSSKRLPPQRIMRGCLQPPLTGDQAKREDRGELGHRVALS